MLQLLKKSWFIFLLFIPRIALSAHYTATGRNIAGLTSEPIRILLPTHSPEGYVFFNYELQYDDSNTKQAKNYVAFYVKDSDHWFEIESADEVGDSDWDNAKTFKAKSDLFGNYSIQTTTVHDAGEIIKTPKIISDWLPCPGAPKDPDKWPKECRFYHLYGSGVSPDDAIQVINSLQLKRE